MKPTPVERYRRSGTLAVYWRGNRLVACEYLSQTQTPLTSSTLEVLERLSDWTSAGDLAATEPSLGPRSHVAELLEVLADRRLVIRQSDAPADLPAGWQSWQPEAAFFHFATKNGRFRPDPQNYHLELVEKAKSNPPPTPTKSVNGAVTRLPQPKSLGRLTQALMTRRTWRRFGRSMIRLTDLATLLNMTFGVQAFGQNPGQGPIVVKTSPSGGARHPIEAYVVALAVRGVPKGSVHHYDAARHELRRLRSRVRPRDIEGMLGHQKYFAGAAALVVMAPVFARSMWRYRSSHAYRAILIDAGHLGQTFCVVAAALNLAPFSTMAMAERRWESILDLDGVAEAPIYVVGVGVKPRDRMQAGWVSMRPTAERAW